MWYTYTMKDHSAIKKNEIRYFTAVWMDSEIITLSEVSQIQISHDNAYIWNRENWYKRTYLQSGNRHTNIETKLMVT